MLYGNNCLVIFYKTFETSYSYTKIGHIDNLEDLGNEDITVILKSSYGNWLEEKYDKDRYNIKHN